MSARLKALLFPLVALAVLTARADFLPVTVLAVHDGDTITVRSHVGKQFRVRLAGIDAPELQQPHGIEARDHLAADIAGKDVGLITSGTDLYGRVIVTVMNHGTDENLAQLKAGFAWVYSKYTGRIDRGTLAAYLAAQTDAHDAKRGLWADEVTQPPWEFRRAKLIERLKNADSP